MPDSDSMAKAPRNQPLDDETAAALTLFNTYLVADREQQAHERALKKAEKAKNDAASAVRKLNDRNTPASETAEAEARYREAAETLQRLRDGDSAPASDDSAPASDDEDTADEPTPAPEAADDSSSVGVEASVGDENLAGDEPAGVAG